MNAGEPHVRRRGFFLHSPDTEPDAGEYENPEGFAIRVHTKRRSVPRQMASSGRSSREQRSEVSQPEIRSGSVTGSRQRAHLPR